MCVLNSNGFLRTKPKYRDSYKTNARKIEGCGLSCNETNLPARKVCENIENINFYFSILKSIHL